MSEISDLLSRRPSPETIKESLETDPNVVPIDDEAADEVFSTLSSTTARSILAELYEQPQTASDIADEVDTSIQNVDYHLNQLSDAGLIEVVEIWYSDQGKEMKVYAPTSRALVLFASDELQQSSIVDAIKRLVGFVGIFALISVIVERVVRVESELSGVSVGVGGGTGSQATFSLSPGLRFFFGSLLALVAVTGWEYFRRR